ncbi:MAG: branched-chain amino acid ABC transporter permease [Pseudomonadota bacterium]
MLSQVLLNGLFISSIYCLVALGLSLILGVMDIADFSQGALYMLGAFIVFIATEKLGINFLFAVILSILLAAIVGVINNALVYQPAMKRGANSLIAALGILLIIQNTSLLIFGSDPQNLNLPFGRENVEILQGTIPLYKLLIMAFSVVIPFMVWLFLQRTKTGKAIRAVSQEKEGASIVGISSGKVSIFTFSIGAAITGFTGALVAPVYAFDVFFGTDIIVKAFTIVIFGGLGSIRGVIVGAMIIGIGENLVAGYISAEYSNMLPLILLILILFVRPQGIFGRRAI